MVHEILLRPQRKDCEQNGNAEGTVGGLKTARGSLERGKNISGSDEACDSLLRTWKDSDIDEVFLIAPQS